MDRPEFAEFSSHLRRQLEHEAMLLLEPHDLTEFVPVITGGRFLRSRIAFQVARDPDQDLMNTCVALELLHSSTLVHDDVIDNALTRRGLQTVSAGRGNETAILIGNLLAARSLEIVGRQPLLAGIFLKTYRSVNAAQLLELQRRWTVDKSLDDYFEVCRGKTASMFQLAITVSVPDLQTRPITPEFSTLFMTALENFGIAFQLSDDLEDVREYLTHSTVHSSKKSELDIEIGNYTGPVILAAKVGSTSADIRSVSIDQISSVEWKLGCKDAATLRNGYLEAALDGLRRVADSDASCAVAASSLLPWLKQVANDLRTVGIDQSLMVI